jgi:hypothetical protein
MKKILTIAFILFISFPTLSQVVLRAGMGIHFQNTPSLTDYINQNYATSAEQRGDFNSAIMFSGEGGYLISENYEVALELGYLLSSYNFSYSLGTYEFFYNVFAPTILNYYVISGTGYQIKFGGGVGMRFVNVEEKQPGLPQADEFSSTGFGLVARADGNTLLGGNLYANIGVDIRYDINGEPENNGNYIENRVGGERVNLNALSFGLRLGVAFIF